MMVLLLIRSIDVYNSDILQTYIVLKDYTADDCIDSAVHTITVSSIFLLPGYCFPLAVFIIASMASAIFALRYIRYIHVCTYNNQAILLFCEHQSKLMLIACLK